MSRAGYTITAGANVNIASQSDASIIQEVSFYISGIEDHVTHSDRLYKIVKIKDDFGLISFPDNPGADVKIKSHVTGRKSGNHDYIGFNIQYDNPNDINFDNLPAFQLQMVNPDNHNQVWDSFDFGIRVTSSYKSLDSFTANIRSSISSFELNNINDPTKDFALAITGNTKNLFYSDKSIKPLITLEIKDDTAGLVSFPNGLKTITLFVDNALTNTSKTTILDISTPVTIKNPKSFGYNQDISINYKLFGQNADGSKFLVYTTDIPASIKTTFEQLPTINTSIQYTGNTIVMFKGANDIEQKYNLAFNIVNAAALTGSNFQVEVKITNDPDNLFTILETNSKVASFDILPSIAIDCLIQPPPSFDYTQNIVANITIQEINVNGAKTNILSSTTPIQITDKNLDINAGIKLLLMSPVVISYSTVHEFRRNYNMDISVSGIDLTANHKIQIQLFDDVDNLFAVFNNDTKTIIVDAAAAISISSYVTNPTQLHYDKKVTMQISLLETRQTAQFVVARSVYPIEIVTTYSTIKRALFDGEREIHISNLKLEPFVVGPTVPNEVFINTNLFNPIVLITPNPEIIFADANVENKTQSIKISITGLGIGTIRLDIAQTDNLTFFENGLKVITYDIDTNLEVSEVDVPLFVSNPFRLNYNKDVEMMYTISDLIDEYSKIFLFKIKTVYTIPDLEAYLISKISSFSTQLKKSVESLTGTISAALGNIAMLTPDTFATLDALVQNFDSSSVVDKLNLSNQFTAVKESIKILNFVETNIQEIPTIVKKDDVTITYYDISNETEVTLNTSEYDFINNQLILNTQFDKGRYILKINQRKTAQLEKRVSTSTQIGNFTFLNITEPISTDISNFKITYQGTEYLIIANSNASILIFGNIAITDDAVFIIDNLFDTQYLLVNVTFYDIDDVGGYFLNKKITDLKTKEETYYDIDQRAILYKLRFITSPDGTTETRNKE